MDWFPQLRSVLSDFYPSGSPGDIVGYLQGSNSPKVWRSMLETRRAQMLILGSAEPTADEWQAAGVAQRGVIQTIRADDLRGFIVTYTGFIKRPWGDINILSADLLKNYQNNTLARFQANMPKKTAVTPEEANRRALLKEVAETADRIRRQLELNRSGHIAQMKILTTVDTSTLKGLGNTAIGIAGFATNALFNTAIPPLTIWTGTENALSAARISLQDKNLGRATADTTLARFEMLLALAKFKKWDDGLHGTDSSMGAGTKMTIAIPVSAFALVAVMFGAMAAAPVVIGFFEGLAATATVGAEGASAATPIVRLAAAVTAAEVKFRIAETAIEELEEAVEAVEVATRPLRRM